MTPLQTRSASSTRCKQPQMICNLFALAVIALLLDNLTAENVPALLLGAQCLLSWAKHMLLLCRLWRSERWLLSLGSMLGGTLWLPRTTVAVKMSLSRWGAAAREYCCLPGYLSARLLAWTLCESCTNQLCQQQYASQSRSCFNLSCQGACFAKGLPNTVCAVGSGGWH